MRPNDNPITRAEGKATWAHQKGDTYIVTGRDREGRRVSRSFTSWGMASCINIWHGSKWLERDGRRWLIQRVCN